MGSPGLWNGLSYEASGNLLVELVIVPIMALGQLYTNFECLLNAFCITGANLGWFGYWYTDFGHIYFGHPNWDGIFNLQRRVSNQISIISPILSLKTSLEWGLLGLLLQTHHLRSLKNRFVWLLLPKLFF